MRTLLFLLAAAGLALAADPPRIVSAGGAVTETIYALGGQGSLVAVDTSSLYPKEASALPKVGYARQLSAEGVLSVAPTLLVANDDAGPPEVLTQLQNAGVKLLLLPNEHTPEAAISRIEKIGAAVAKVDQAGELVRKLREDLDQAKQRVSADTTKPKVLFIYARGGGVMNVSGKGSAADAMIALAGGVNAISDFEGYKPLTAEAVVAAAPDIILLTDGGLQSSGGVDALLKQPGLALTPAGQAKRVVTLDDVLLLGFGPRLGQAVLALNERLHAKPDVAKQ